MNIHYHDLPVADVSSSPRTSAAGNFYATTQKNKTHLSQQHLPSKSQTRAATTHTVPKPRIVQSRKARTTTHTLRKQRIVQSRKARTTTTHTLRKPRIVQSRKARTTTTHTLRKQRIVQSRKARTTARDASAGSSEQGGMSVRLPVSALVLMQCKSRKRE